MSPEIINGLLAGPAVGLAILLYVYFTDKKAHKDAIDTLTKAHKDAIAALTADLKEEREHNRKFGEAWMALATETKIHLEHAPKPIQELGELVKEEHVETRKTITDNAG